MTRKYLESIGSNTLHIHDLDNDVGTTFTHNDQLKGRTALGHLDDHAINSLDGIVAIGKGAYYWLDDNNNTAVGSNAGYSSSSGNGNTLLGYYAGYGIHC